ncbi:sugar ABC transporter ATP-binding protein [Acidisoma silvae]|uniref:Sugar ABC transporter ATP-binding protein n=1 Tax=Acidisoma silvae TaxID=2802396 RepID=A0A963YVC6_9PROT|nr:sugar ABC transporter ATP-binding protein [Acidisoma silvae]MCB8877511.1 sugar ABC transporter ATP-binding protein [Acidisoma silvae]
MHQAESPATVASRHENAVTISARDVTKEFGGVKALKGVSVDFYAGEVHALVGENGAGKSTFLGTLAGRVSPTTGSLTAFGHMITGANPRASRAAGIVAIYQELTMIPARTACENVFLGQFPTRLGIVDHSKMRARFEVLCQKFGVHMDADARTDTLSIADQQLLEIMRAYESAAKAVLFDEPTASLGESERARLLDIIRQMKANGTTIAFVSHHLDEVLAVSDRITVFRDGSVVASRPTSAWTKQQIVTEMLGSELKSTLQQRPLRPTQMPRDLLKVSDIAVAGLLYPASFVIRAGEVLGIAGLVGSGRTSLLRALAGLEPATGRLEIDEVEKPAPRTPRAARALGIALIPEDRKGQGLVLSRSSACNVILGDMPSIARFRILREPVIMKAASAAVVNYGFNLNRLSAPARTLSGGNQQKLMLGRWHHARPRVLLADEPTRGIDIGAKTEILAALRKAALEEGLAVVIVSSELEELLVVSDRILIMRDGHMVDTLDCHSDDVDVERILHSAFAVHAASLHTEHA